jgi:hypothetical protein
MSESGLRLECEARDETDRLYVQMHYEDMVARISEGKQSAWSVVQWTFAAIGAVAGIWLSEDGFQAHRWLAPVGVVAIGGIGTVLLLALRADVRAHRVCLMELRRTVMGGWVHDVFKDLPTNARWGLLVQVGMLALGTIAISGTLWVVSNVGG